MFSCTVHTNLKEYEANSILKTQTPTFDTVLVDFILGSFLWFLLTFQTFIVLFGVFAPPTLEKLRYSGDPKSGRVRISNGVWISNGKLAYTVLYIKLFFPLYKMV